MLASSIPAKFPIPFGASAGNGFIRPIPVASQIGVNAGFASLTDGFVPLNFTPVAAGGVPPFGADVNGILYQLSQWSQWQGAGGPINYDATFSGEVGGYPLGAVVGSNLVLGRTWMSTVDNNATNPDSSSAANWVPGPGCPQIGAMGYTFSSSAPFNCLMAVGNFTIGNAASGATYASSNALFLYLYTWATWSNSVCPVAGGRGANAIADFNAGKPIQIFDMQGSGLIGQAGATGRLNGVPVVSGAVNLPGSIIGETLHNLVVGEIPAHAHDFNVNTQTESALHTHGGVAVFGGSGAGITSGGVAAPITGGSTGSESPFHTHNVLGTTTNTGSSASHNNVERSATVNWFFYL